MTSSPAEPDAADARSPPGAVPVRDGYPDRPRVQVALMTGRSDPHDARPSAVQSALLDALAMPGVDVERTNFPWPRAADDAAGTVADPHDVATPVPILRASVRNAAQYAGSRGRRWRARHRPGVETWIARADRTVLLCGSCGLELLANLSLSPEARTRLHVFAWGPVARRLPVVARLELVQGRTDRLSRCWIARDRVDHVVEGGHLDYLHEPTVIALATRFVGRVHDEAAREGRERCG